jgi:ubiquinone/menaquinone biosynthesis C-methylase UbiE
MNSQNPAMHRIRSATDVKEYYFDEKRAQDYIDDRFRSPLFRMLHNKQVQAVNDLIVAENLGRLLELAPGPARLSVHIRNFTSGTLVDSSQAMLDVARQRLEAAGALQKWSFEQADIFNLGLNETFDLVYTFRFIRHFEKDKRQQLYDVIRRHLEPGGWLIFDAVNEAVSAPLREASPEEYPVYDELYRKPDLIDELNEEGFEVHNLISLQCHFSAQKRINDLARFGVGRLAEKLIVMMERPDAPNPLEWIVVCRKV